jgi:hypothetical protein
MLFGSAFFAIFVGCEMWPDGWWAAFSLLPMFLSGVPDLFWNRFCTRKSDDIYSGYDEDGDKNRKWITQGWEDFLFVSAGFLMISTFWIPITEVIVGIIDPKTLGVVISGCFVVMVTYFIFIKLIYHKFNLRIYDNTSAFKIDSDEEEPDVAFLSREEYS